MKHRKLFSQPVVVASILTLLSFPAMARNGAGPGDGTKDRTGDCSVSSVVSIDNSVLLVRGGNGNGGGNSNGGGNGQGGGNGTGDGDQDGTPDQDRSQEKPC